MKVKGLELRARIEDREGGCTVGGLLFECCDDGVGLGMCGHADGGRLVIYSPSVEENGIFNADGVEEGQG